LYMNNSLSEAQSEIEMQKYEIEMLSEIKLELIGFKWNKNYSSDDPSIVVSGYVYNVGWREAWGVKIEIVFLDHDKNVFDSSTIDVGTISMRSDQGFEVELSCPKYPEFIRAVPTHATVPWG